MITRNNKKEENKINKNLIFIVILILSIVLTSYLTLNYSNSQLEDEIERIEEFNKYYFKGVTEFNNGIFDNSNAEFNYDSWSFYYDEGYFLDSIEYCVSARDLYASANSYHQDSISNFEEAYKIAEEKYKGLIDYYIKASDQAIDINWAMYEACEYFESASDSYSKELWDSGDAELEIGNEKIELHDSLVRDYNKYISKIEVLEEKI